jgi:DnaJ family protein C protein 7
VDALLASANLKDADTVSKELMTVSGKRDPACLYSRARVLHYLGQSVQAEAHVTEALRLDQEHAPSAKLRRLIRKAEDLKKKANDAFKTEKWQIAIDLYTNCLDVDPRNASYNARILTNRAATWSKLGRHSDAFEDASLAIAACETWAKGYIRRGTAGVAMADLEHLQGAVRDFTKACELLAAQPETDGSKEGALREAESGLKHAKAGLKAAKRKDYYKILEVERSCNDDAIKKAYRKAALKWHPDKHAMGEPQERLKAESMFKDVTEAYSVLSDSTKRQQFDQGMVPDGSGSMSYPDDDEPHSHRGHGHGHGGGGGFRRGGMGGMGGMGGGGGGMDLDPELIAHLFGGMGGGGGMRGGMRGGMPGGMPGGMGGRR